MSRDSFKLCVKIAAWGPARVDDAGDDRSRSEFFLFFKFNFCMQPFGLWQTWSVFVMGTSLET